MNKIRPCIWFNNQGEEAMNFYLSVFSNSKITYISRYGDAGPGPSGSLLAATFVLEGNEISILNGGPHYTITPAISLFITCKSQEEVDHYWDKLGAEGTIMQCGWLTDKYGVTWQVVPDILGRYLADEDRAKSNKVMLAMMKMKKIIISDLEAAYNS